LDGYIDVLTTAKTIRKMDKSRIIKVTGHTVTQGVELLGDRGVRNDDTGNCGSVVSLHKYKLRGSPSFTIVGGHTQKPNAEGVMDVVSRIKEVNT
jgi:hypothetical protein